MGQENVQQTGEKIFALIEVKFGSDAAFERAANLPLKTVNNWRRGRSASYMKMLPEIAALFGIPVRELIGGESGEPTLTPDEQALLALYRSADGLSDEERAALNATLRNTIDLYLASRPGGAKHG